jgi:hypothetical protein
MKSRSYALAGMIAGAIGAATILIAASAQAQTYDPNYPVCLQVYQGSMVDYYFECGYTSIEQCQASASGRSAQCVVNPYYEGPVKPAPRHQRHHPH